MAVNNCSSTSNMHSVLQCFYGPAEEEKLFTAASVKYSTLLKAAHYNTAIQNLQSRSNMMNCESVWSVAFC